MLHLGAQVPIYYYIKFKPAGAEQIKTLIQKGLAIDHFETLQDGSIHLLVSEYERSILDDQAINYQITEKDVARNTEKRLLATAEKRHKGACGLLNLTTGSMGGYHTLQEIEEELDEMHRLYPQLISEKASIGKSLENRDIWFVKLSDNPTIDESTSEGVLYLDGLTHAREPMSMEVLLYYLWYLLENYNTNAQVKYLVDHREIYVLPCINPDGYEYNRSTYPNGGGMHRKNRRNTASCSTSSWGVDLNRNHDIEWGDAGTYACGETYQGPNAASEPETQAVEAFIDEINPSIALSNHSFAHKLLSPWGYKREVPNYEEHLDFASAMVPENYGGYGSVYEILGVEGSGSTLDYLASKGVVGWTPEIGTRAMGGFWPNPSNICTLNEEFMKIAWHCSWVAGDFCNYRSHRLISSEGLIPGSTNELQVRLINRGRSLTSKNVEVILQTDNEYVELTDIIVEYDDLAPRQITSGNANFVINVSPEAEFLEKIEFTIKIKQNGQLCATKRIDFIIGGEQVLFEDNAENASTNWTGWDITEIDGVSGTHSFSDSKYTSYSPSSNESIILNTPIDLDGTLNPLVEFETKYSLEPTIDEVLFQLSTDNGDTWETLETFTGHNYWHIKRYDLSAYSNSAVLFRFELSANYGTNSDGFYFDDFRVVDYYDAITTGNSHAAGNLANLVEIYPVPARQELFFRTKANDISFTANIVDHLGRVVFNKSNITYNDKIDLSTIRPGNYFIELETESMRYYSRVEIRRE